jgi:GrpB-like predicted nucleotidyltransferase (UPF0157 family)
VETACAEHRRRVLGLLPWAEVEHVGSTAIRGALTKGDVDLLVRVEAGEFDAAIAGLRGLYAVDQPENRTRTFASFSDARAAAPPVGVQLVVVGSADDALFGRFCDALVADPALLAEYNALKLRNDGEGYEHYTEVKAEFERVLARLGRRSP